MTFPTSSTLLVPVRQDSDGALTENYAVPGSAPYTHRLGAGLAQPYPATWQLLPKGAFPINPPGAPSAGALVSESGGLVSGGAYSWALTNVTANGETIAGASYTVGAIGAGTAYKFALPAASQGTPDAPVAARRLYRTANGGATLGFVAEIRDLALTHYVDKTPDADLGDAPPGANGSGLPQTVALTGSSQTWTERAPGATLAAGDYIVDYSKSPTGGAITHSAADAGKAVTASYTASTYLTSAFVGALVAALADIGGAAGQANGIATLNGAGLVAQPAATGARGTAAQALGGTHAGFSSFGAWANFPGLAPLTLTSSGGTVVATLKASLSEASSTSTSVSMKTIAFGVLLDGATLCPMGSHDLQVGQTAAIALATTMSALSGTHTFQLQYKNPYNSFTCSPGATPEQHQLSLLLEEVA